MCSCIFSDEGTVLVLFMMTRFGEFNGFAFRDGIPDLKACENDRRRIEANELMDM
jgi:hypothetical protein